MNISKCSVKIGGEAGFGIMVTGNILAKMLSRAGYWLFGYPEYPSLIRGGHNTYQIDFSNEKIYAPDIFIDVLVALNTETITLHEKELSQNSIIIFEENEQFSISKKVNLLPLPLLHLAKDSGGDILMRNTVALGALCAVLKTDIKILERVLTDQFLKKGETVCEQNIKAARNGYKAALLTIKNKKLNIKLNIPTSSYKQKTNKITLSLNEAIGLSSIVANCKFFSAYPMTPINGLITFMASYAEKFNFIYKQPEDEIAAINMALGASFSGVRSMTATSGGGFSLMTEAFGLSGMAEIPLVVVMGQRPGPSSGLPTWTSQGDLNFMINASQGEFLRFVLAPGDLEEAYNLTLEAFNLADKYQTPVIILIDKFLAESIQNTEKFLVKKILPDLGKFINFQEFEKLSDYKRYQITSDGISPRALPGKGGPALIYNSYEHDEYGFSTENASQIKKMVEKRRRKEEKALLEAPPPKIYGPGKATYTLIGWGSTKGPVIEALKYLNSNTNVANYLHFTHLNPINNSNLSTLFKNINKPVLIEGNTIGQLGEIIKAKMGIAITNRFLKYDGRPFFPTEIVKFINNL